MNFNDALDELGNRIDLPLIKKATVLINEAAKHGGDLSNIFDSTAKYLDSINSWTAKRRQQTTPYVLIFLLLSLHVSIHNYHHFQHDVYSLESNWRRQRIFY